MTLTAAGGPLPGCGAEQDVGELAVRQNDRKLRPAAAFGHLPRERRPPRLDYGHRTGLGPRRRTALRIGEATAAVLSQGVRTVSAARHPSMVDTSPTSAPVSLAFRKRRRIFPERVLGSAVTNSRAAGVAIGPSSRRTCSISAAPSASDGAWPWRSLDEGLDDLALEGVRHADDGAVAALGVGVAVQGVHGDVGLAAREPAVMHAVPVEDAVLLPRPRAGGGLLGPEALRIFDRRRYSPGQSFCSSCLATTAGLGYSSSVVRRLAMFSLAIADAYSCRPPNCTVISTSDGTRRRQVYAGAVESSAEVEPDPDPAAPRRPK